MVTHPDKAPAAVVQCACGKRYRLPVVHAGQRARCRHCGSTLTIPARNPLPAEPAADVAPAAPAGGTDWLALANGPAIERPAPPPDRELEVSRPPTPAPVAQVHRAAPDFPVPSTATVPPTFLWDLLTSFCLAGSKSNAVNLLLTAVGCAVPALISQIPILGCLALPLVLVLSVCVSLFVVHFYWSTLTRTAAGEDDIPVTQTDWTFWEDAIKPALWLLAITAICLGPAYYLHVRLADDPNHRLFVATALLAGSFFWPVAVMSVALGETLLFLRPDWLVRCIWGIGPVYLVAWLQILLTLGFWYLFNRAERPLDQPGLRLLAPIAGYAAELYFGYIVFRTLGLLFRHYRTRFPWKF